MAEVNYKRMKEEEKTRQALNRIISATAPLAYMMLPHNFSGICAAKP